MSNRTLPDGRYIISNLQDPSYFLNTVKKPKISTCIGSTQDKSHWSIVCNTDDGSYSIWKDGTDAVLDSSTSTAGTRVITFRYHGRNNQRWRIVGDGQGAWSFSPLSHPWFQMAMVDRASGNAGPGKLHVTVEYSGTLSSNEEWWIMERVGGIGRVSESLGEQQEGSEEEEKEEDEDKEKDEDEEE